MFPNAPWRQIPPHRVQTWNNIKIDPNANGFRLPRDIEWQFIKYLIGRDVLSNIDEYAWTNRNSEGHTHPVGTKRPTTFGLYDFLGNVYEWRQEQRGNFQNHFFRYRDAEEEAFYNSLSYRPFRQIEYIRVRDIQGLWPMHRSSQVGFRVVRQKPDNE